MKNLIEIGRINSIKHKEKRQMELRKWIAAMEFLLFGDGVASLVLANEGGRLSVGEIVEVTNLREKDYLAGYTRLTALNEPFKFGLYSHLDKEIPTLGVEYISTILRKLLKGNVEKSLNAAKKLAVHTGSQKILNLIAEQYQIPSQKLEDSHEVLREYGNLAGASLPFILEKITAKHNLARNDTIVTLGYGWGFSASGTILRQV